MIGKITPTIRSISLTPIVKSGKIRVVVSWPDAPSDLDMVSTFRLDKVDTKCEVFFGKKNCSQTSLQVDNNLRTRKGAETITIDMLENYIYTFAIRKYVDKSSDGLFPGEERVDGAPKNSDYNSKMLLDREKLEPLMNVTLSESKAKVSIFVNGYKSAIQEIYVPENPQKNLLFKKDQNNPYLDWWLAFCLDGAEGLTSMKIVNKLSSENPNESYCEKYYNKQPKAKILIANITETSDSQPTSQMNTNATEITVPSSGILNKTLSFVQKSQSIFNLNMKKLDPKNLHYYRF